MTLERCVGKVDIDLHVSSDYMWRFIRKIDITFDDAEGIYAGLSAMVNTPVQKALNLMTSRKIVHFTHCQVKGTFRIRNDRVKPQ